MGPINKRTAGDGAQELAVSFATGALTEAAMQAVAHKVPAVANDYSKYKMLGAGVLGAIILLAGKGSLARTAGLAMLGVAGGSAGSLAANAIMNGGKNKRLNGIQQKLAIKRQQLATRGGAPIAPTAPAAAALAPSNMNQQYLAHAFSDAIYL